MVYSTRRFVVCLSVCHFALVFFSPSSIAITLLGEDRANLSAFRMVCACLDLPVSSSSWGLGRAAVCDCGTPWTFFLPFFHIWRLFCRCVFLGSPSSGALGRFFLRYSYCGIPCVSSLTFFYLHKKTT